MQPGSYDGTEEDLLEILARSYEICKKKDHASRNTDDSQDVRPGQAKDLAKGIQDLSVPENFDLEDTGIFTEIDYEKDYIEKLQKRISFLSSRLTEPKVGKRDIAAIKAELRSELAQLKLRFAQLRKDIQKKN